MQLFKPYCTNVKIIILDKEDESKYLDYLLYMSNDIMCLKPEIQDFAEALRDKLNGS